MVFIKTLSLRSGRHGFDHVTLVISSFSRKVRPSSGTGWSSVERSAKSCNHCRRLMRRVSKIPPIFMERLDDSYVRTRRNLVRPHRSYRDHHAEQTAQIERSDCGDG